MINNLVSNVRNKTYCFWVELVSVLRQHFIHARLIRIRHESKSPVLNKTKQKQPLKKGKQRETYRVMLRKEHKDQGASDRTTGRTPLSPRPLGGGIPYHHTLLHLAEFTEVLFQALCRNNNKNKKKTLEIKNNKTIKRIILNRRTSEATTAEGAGRTAVSLYLYPPLYSVINRL